ncbi:MAG: amidohydrolase [candidate division Zixibacteria bacterium]|nr:amidohydrolase [candidate division Zixibacteria bacterium]
MKQPRDTFDEIRKIAGQIHPEQVRWRRHLHAHPELSTQEFETTAFLTKQLRTLGARVVPLRKMKTGVIAELTGHCPGPVVAIRSDIDALPICEKSGVPFASKITGRMHACGHDMHMATVLGAVAVLSQMRERFSGTVRFIFQPAEEVPPGGARPMIAEGALKNVKVIFGLHVDPTLATGKISLRDGVTMASVCDFDLIIHGSGGHAARPHTTVDSITCAAEVVDSIQKIVSREIDPILPAAITFGRIEGGTARNVIADRVTLTGTARSLSPELARRLPALIRRTTAGICKARGAKFEMKEIARYPVLSNHARVNRLLASNYEQLFGPGKIETTPVVLGGEDFACYLEKVPGSMFRLGVMNKKIKADKPWHSDRFIADEQALIFGTSLFCAAVVDVLGKDR